MSEKNTVRSAPKILFWISFFFVVLVGIAITSDALGFTLPVFVSDRIYVINYSQPVPGSYKPEEVPSVLNVTSTNAPVQRNTVQKKIKTHIAFLKVHKAGSTTMQNLFFRFGLRHKLNILLPKSGNYFFSKTPKMPLKSGQHYDIFASHTVYSKQWFDSLLPADSVKIGIVREPVSRMISSAYYYRDVWREGYLKKVPRANFIHNIVNYPEKYDISFFSRTRNSMGKDFGFPSGVKPSKVKDILDELNSQFLLVLVMERFDESLVLMKKVLNWSLIDILYLKMNSHKHHPIVLTKTEMAKFRQTNFLDFEIYDYFSKVFETKIQLVDGDFIDEVSFFKTVLDQVSRFCSKIGKAENASLVIHSSKWDDEFKVSDSDCQWMQTESLVFLSKLRMNQTYS